MRKPILLMTIPLILAAILLTPVSALPKSNTQFAEHVSMTAGSISQGSQTVQGNILYVENGISTGTVTQISGLDLSGTLWTKLSGYYDMTTGLGRFNGKWIITIASGDTFEGNVAGVISTIDPNNFHIEGSYVGFGTGNFKGDKIKGSFSGNAIAGVLSVELDMTGSLNDKSKK